MALSVRGNVRATKERLLGPTAAATPRCAHLSSPSLQMSPPFSPFFFLTTQPEFSPRASCTVPSRLPDSQPLDFPDLVTPTLVNAKFYLPYFVVIDLPVVVNLS